MLVRWDPDLLYRDLIPDDEQRRAFLRDICSPAWNDAQDRGRSLAEGTALLQAAHPGHAELIAAYYRDWLRMLGGEVDGMGLLVADLQALGLRVVGLTNFSAETWPLAVAHYDVLARLDAVVVSGREGCAKPDPEIFAILSRRHGIHAARAVFADDNPDHVGAARRLGWRAYVFTDAAGLRRQLRAEGVAVATA